VDHTKPKGKPGFDNPKGLNFDLIPSGEGEGGAKVDDTKNATSASETIVHLNPTGTSNKENAAGDAPAINEDSALATDLSTLEFTNIYFDYGKSSLSPSSKQQLDIMAEFLSKHPDVSMNIAGHADASGSVEYNQTLSENRAKAAYNYLRNKGITNITLAAEELNEKDPADDNSNAAGRQNDRRVEFRLLRNAKVIARSGPRLRI
jgi:outer membrane protein OmpA-like peptidoglycan-associated protein